MSGRQKSIVGTVVSDKMDKTVIVRVESTTRHRLYRKILKRSKRYLAHDDRFDAKPGDLVLLLETRPLSRHKRWRVAEILQRGEVPELAPREIDIEYIGRPREREEQPTASDEAPATEAMEQPTLAAEESSEAPESAPQSAETSAQDEPLVETPATQEVGANDGAGAGADDEEPAT